MFNLLSFLVPDMQIDLVRWNRKRTNKTPTKSVNKAEMTDEKIRALGNSTELRLEMKICDYYRTKGIKKSQIGSERTYELKS